MPPEWALIWIGLVVSLTVGAFERIGIWFTSLCFNMQWVQFFVCLAVPPEFTVVLRFVRFIAFDAFWPLDSTWKGCMTPPAVVLALEHTQIHVSTANSGNVSSKVKAPVNETLSFLPTLEVPDVYPNNQHVWFWKDFDNPGFWGQFDVIENMVLLESWFYITNVEALLGLSIWEIWNASDFEI